MNAQEIINEFHENEKKYSGGANTYKGVILGQLNKACRNDSNRHMLLKVLTGKTSSRELTEEQWFGLLLMTQPEKPEGGHWQSGIGDYELYEICQKLLNFAVDQPGQGKLPF